MRRIDRLFAITLLLQTRGRARAKDLAEWFEVSERTIYRDIAALSEGGVPVVSLPGVEMAMLDPDNVQAVSELVDALDVLFLGLRP